MSISYKNIKKSPAIFNRLFGLTLRQFDLMIPKIKEAWSLHLEDSYKKEGRSYKLSIEDMTLMLLLYYKTYTTMLFVGFLFDIDKSRVCRNIQSLEPILAKIMALPKKKQLSKEEVESLIIDATEQRIERPKRRQKAYYSGKKKAHTLKTEIRTTCGGKIVGVSKPHPGSVHDFNILKQGKPIFEESRVYVDSGYQGLSKIHQASEYPYKKTKGKELTGEEKEYNHTLSRIRVKVENVLRSLKIFKILADKYRNKRKRYGIKFRIIAGIVNMKYEFTCG